MRFPEAAVLAELVRGHRLGPPLGRGELGWVLRAYERGARTWRALKVSPDRARLRAEVDALQRVEEAPAFTRVHGWFESDALAAFTMDLVAGDDPVDWIRGDVVAAPERALRRNLPMAFGYELQDEGISAYQRCTEEGLGRLRVLGASLALALDALHAAGRLHLDVQPPNVRVEPGGHVRLLDLGLSHPIGEPFLPERLAGTPAYLAPELALGKVGPASDVYSLGVLLYEALTGRRPFDGGGAEVLVRKQTIEAPRATEVGDGVPAPLDELLAAMLRRDPAGRPAARDVVTALR